MIFGSIEGKTSKHPDGSDNGLAQGIQFCFILDKTKNFVFY